MTSQAFGLFKTPIEDGATLIEASAGTGKTYTLASLVLRLLLERRLEVDQILTVTFTIAAAEELKNKVRARLRQAKTWIEQGLPQSAREQDPHLAEWLDAQKRATAETETLLRDALIRVDQLQVATIHAFCKQALEESAFESGQPFAAGFVENDRDLVLRAAEDFWRARIYGGGALLAALTAARGWTPETFLNNFRDFRRFPDAVMEPEPGDMAAILADIEAALAQLRRLWNRESFAEALGRAQYNKDGPVYADLGLTRFLDGVAALLDGDFTRLGLLERLDPAKVHKSLAKRSADQKARCEAVMRHPFMAALDRLGLRALLDRLERQLRQDFILETGRRFEAHKETDNVLTFDDLLLKLRDALRSQERGSAIANALRGRYRAALIDEFQDTDDVQYEIFQRLFHDRPFFLIGDPKQAIYSFRGADVFTYLKAKKNARRAYTLTKNWRSHSRLIAAVNGLFGMRERPFLYDGIGFEPAQPAGRADSKALVDPADASFNWRLFQSESRLNKDNAKTLVCHAAANDIVDLLERRPMLGDECLQPGDIAVLTRTNDQARAVQDALRQARVPSVIAQAGDIFQSREMAELGLILQAILAPQRNVALHAALATETWGFNAAEIRGLREDERQRQELIGRCLDYRETWRKKGFLAMIQRFLYREGARIRLQSFPDGERRLTNLLHAAEMIHQRAEETRLAPEGLLRWLEIERGRPSHDDDPRQLRLESDARAVSIVTVHKAKGLEFPVVFCPFLWDAVPVKNRDAVVVHEDEGTVFDCGSERLAARCQRAEQERLAEDLRLAYVALTRAEQRCCVYWGDFGQKVGQSALAYLLKDGSPEVLARRHPESMSLRTQDDAPPPVRAWEPPEEASAELTARELPDLGDRLSRWRMASFTLFARGRGAETPDYLDPAEPAAETVEPEGIFAFAKGARAGVCLHDLFERIDLAAPDDDALATKVREILRRHDLLGPERHPRPIEPDRVAREMFLRIRDTAIPGLNARFADIPRDRRFHEWAFYLPMAEVSPHGLGDIFAEYGVGRVRDEYAPLAAALDQRQVHGFLNGFVDLCFEWGSRWYIVDWKSNFLGARSADYDDAGLWTAMRAHHYVLQYSLYLLALHRYLGARLADYDYDRHVGGALYVFLRGVDGDPAHGWHFDLPPRALIEALDRFFEGREAA